MSEDADPTPPTAEAAALARRDVLIATICIGVLGCLWLVFRLWWQGLILLAVAGALAYLGYFRNKNPPASPTYEQGSADKRSGASRRKRRR